MNALIHKITLPVVCLWLTACSGGIPGISEPKADVSSPATYSKKGLEFQYPGNWTPGEEMDMFGVMQAGAESSGSAIVLVHKFPGEVADDISTYAKDFSESMKENVPVGNIGSVNHSPVTKQGEYEAITMNFSISLLGETVPHECTIYRKQTGSNVLFIIAQAATEDLGHARPGFDLVRQTLKYESP